LTKSLLSKNINSNFINIHWHWLLSTDLDGSVVNRSFRWQHRVDITVGVSSVGDLDDSSFDCVVLRDFFVEVVHRELSVPHEDRNDEQQQKIFVSEHVDSCVHRDDEETRRAREEVPQDVPLLRLDQADQQQQPVENRQDPHQKTDGEERDAPLEPRLLEGHFRGDRGLVAQIRPVANVPEGVDDDGGFRVAQVAIFL
jgi:hypothetical protein